MVDSFLIKIPRSAPFANPSLITLEVLASDPRVTTTTSESPPAFYLICNASSSAYESLSLTT